jgi:hypothetical protein
MSERKTSSKLKSSIAAQAWDMLLKGESHADIGKALGYTKAAITAYAKRKFKKESMKLWSKEIVAVGMCEIPGCGKTEDLQAHHLLEKTVWTHLSRDLTNGICLCSHHHKWNLDICPHGVLPAVLAFFAFIVMKRAGVLYWYEEKKLDQKYQPFDYEAAYHELNR